MKPNQKLRLVMNGIHVYTTAKKIREGIGDRYTVNAATQKCLLVLENMRKHDKIPPVGSDLQCVLPHLHPGHG